MKLIFVLLNAFITFSNIFMGIFYRNPFTINYIEIFIPQYYEMHNIV